MAAASAVPGNASDAAVLAALRVDSESDRAAFREIYDRLAVTQDGGGGGCGGDGGPPSIPANVVAAVLTVAAGGLGSPDAYLGTPDAPPGAPPRGGLRGLALNYVRFRSRCGPPPIGGSSPPSGATLVEVARRCSDLVKAWEAADEPAVLGRLYRHFSERACPAAGPGGGGGGARAVGELSSPGAAVGAFAGLLAKTLDRACLATAQCLEDRMDFEYLWASTLNDPAEDAPLFGPGGGGGSDDACAEAAGARPQPHPQPQPQPQGAKKGGAAKGGTRKRKGGRGGGPPPPVPPESVRRTAKDLAWAFSRMAHTFQPSSEDGNGGARSENAHRKRRIVNAAACIDIVAAALMAPIISAPPNRRRRLENGDFTPCFLVEDESAAALSPMIQNPSIDPKGLRQMSKESLLQATADLLSAVAEGSEPIDHGRDVVATAQKVAKSVLPFLTDNGAGASSKKSSPSNSPASHLLSFISSHAMRERSLRLLKEGQHRALWDRVRVASTNAPLGTSNERKALIMGGAISKLQRNFFIDAIGEFCLLGSSERKMLAPLASSREMPPHQAKQLFVRAIEYTPKVTCADPPEGWPSRHAVQISRVENSPRSDAESKDLKEWISAMHRLVSASPSIKPSPRLKSHIESSMTSIPDKSGNVNDWETNILPVLNCFLAIVAKNCSIGTGTCAISDAGEYKVQQVAEPAAVLQLYYFALESIIFNSPGTMLAFDERFHSSLFSVCYFCIQKANNPCGQYFLIEDIGDCAIKFHHLVGLFVKVMIPRENAHIAGRPDNPRNDSATAKALPSYLIRVLCQLQDMVLGMVWMAGYNCLHGKVENTFVAMVNHLRKSPGTWRHTCSFAPSGEKPPTRENSREELLIVYMLRNLAHLVQRRVANLCNVLWVTSAADTTYMTMKIFTTLLRDRTDIFFDRHPDQLMLCSLYAAMRLMGKSTPDVSFRKITDAYMVMNRYHLGSEISYAIVHRIKNCSGCDGDIISLYNEVFLPSLKPFWQSFKDGPQAKMKINKPPKYQAMNAKVVDLTQSNNGSSDDESKCAEDRTDRTRMDVEVEACAENERNSSQENEFDSELEAINSNILNAQTSDETTKGTASEEEMKKFGESSVVDAQFNNELDVAEAPSTEEVAIAEASCQEQVEAAKDKVEEICVSFDPPNRLSLNLNR